MKHMIVLVLGVIAAFYVGMKLGEIKGYMMGGYGMVPNARHGWMMERDYAAQTPPVQPTR